MKKYDSLKELLSADIVYAAEGVDKFYARVKPSDFFENAIWSIDKRTGKIEYMLFTSFLQANSAVKEMEPTELKRKFQNANNYR